MSHPQTERRAGFLWWLRRRGQTDADTLARGATLVFARTNGWM